MAAFGERLFAAGLLTWFLGVLSLGALSSANEFPTDMVLGAIAVVAGCILIDLGSPQSKGVYPCEKS